MPLMIFSHPFFNLIIFHFILHPVYSILDPSWFIHHVLTSSLHFSHSISCFQHYTPQTHSSLPTSCSLLRPLCSMHCPCTPYSILCFLLSTVTCFISYGQWTTISIFLERVKHQIRPLQHPAETTGTVWLREQTKVTASDWGFVHIQQRPLEKPHWGNHLGFPMRILGTAESPQGKIFK